MHRAARTLAGLATMLGLGLGLGVAPAVARVAPGPQDGWAGTGIVSAPGGPYLTDRFGRRLQLHGSDLVAKCGGGATPRHARGTPCVGPARGSAPAFVLTPHAVDPGRRFTDAEAATLASLGFDVVRLGIVWEGLEPGPRGVRPNDPTYCAPHAPGTPFPALGAADPYNARVVGAYLHRVGVIVSELAAHGIRVIIDMHQDAFGSAFRNPRGRTPWNGEGAPPWATCTGRVPFVAPAWWGDAAHRPAVEAADHNFLANDVSGDLQGQFVRVWQAVARHFRGDADVIGYELLNEPADFSLPYGGPVSAELECDYGGPALEPASCAESGAQALPGGWIGAIRNVDPDHVVFYEPPIDNNPGDPERIGISEPLRFGDLAFAFHLYQPQSAIDSLIEPELAATVTDQPGGPAIIMDEFGGTHRSRVPAEEVALADRLGISWSYWATLELHDPTGNPREFLLSQRTGLPVAAKARALSVPYPIATAGAPLGDVYDPARRRLRFSYAPAAAIRAPTELEIPTFTYPSGYCVAVTGGRVSAHGTSLLDVVPDPGAASVTVTVTPARRHGGGAHRPGD